MYVMQLKSKEDPINVLVIKQNAGTSGSVSLSTQCQLATHSNNALTSTYSTGPGTLEGEVIGHLYKHNMSRTTNSGVAIVSQSTETEVTSTISGSIVSPAVAGQNNVRISDLHSINEMSEMPQDDGEPQDTSYLLLILII